ncbi:MAG: hypothetical protein HC867_10260 [Bacteroidia bacterium]|nr:hypothetical protein [Bacteroidia bacterium]
MEEISRLGREKQKQFLRYFNHLLQQAIRLRVMTPEKGSSAYIPEKEMDFVLRLNKAADIAQQQAIIEELDKASYYIERNANAKNPLSCPYHQAIPHHSGQSCIFEHLRQKNRGKMNF